MALHSSIHNFIVVEDTGFVGVGTTNPDKRLDVYGTIRAFDSGAPQLQVRPSQLINYGGDLVINAQSAGDDVRIKTQSGDRVIVTAEGKMGVGKFSSLGATLHVESPSGDGSGIRVSRAGNTSYMQLYPAYSGVPTVMGFSGGLHMGYNSATNGIRIDTSNNVGIGTITPTRTQHGSITPKLHVLGSSGNGEFRLAARFQAGADADNTGVSVLFNHSNDRGLLIEAGRAESDRGIAHFGIVKSDGTNIRGMSLRQDNSVVRVGIGTTNPTSGGRLFIQHSATTENIIYSNRYNDSNLKPIFAVAEATMVGMSATGLVIGNHNRDIHIGSVFGAPTLDTATSNGMRITSTGNVGIGTHTPGGKLHLWSNGDATLIVEADADNSGENDNPSVLLRQDGRLVEGLFGINGTGGNVATYAADNDLVIGHLESTTTNNGIVFATRGASSGRATPVVPTVRMRINGAGKVGIGNTDPQSTLQVGPGSSNSTSPVMQIGRDGGNAELLALSLVNSRSGQLGNGTAIAFHNASNYSPTGKISVVQAGDAVTDAEMRFYTYAGGLAQRMVIAHDGEVGIGTNNPLKTLDVRGNAAFTGDTGNPGTAGAGVYLGDYAHNGGVNHTSGEVVLVSDGKTGWNWEDKLGRIRWRTNDGSGIGTRDLASIEAVSEAGNGSTTTTMSAALTFSTSGYNANQGERMRITDGGDVGIGVQAPQGRLHVRTGSAGAFTTNAAHDDIILEGSGNTGINIFSPNTSYQYLAFGDPEGSNTGYVRYYHGGNQMVLRAGGSDTVYINDGRVGIGSASPDEKLHVVGQGSFENAGNTQRGNIIVGPHGNGTNKWGTIASTHYNDQTGSGNGSGAAGVMLIGGSSTSSGNTVYIGHGPYEINPATEIRIGTHTATTHNLGGSTKMYIKSDGDVGIGTGSPGSKLHIYQAAQAPTLLTLHNYHSDINGGGDSQGNFIDFKMTDDNATATPQVRIGMKVYDNDGSDAGIPSEGAGNFVVYAMDPGGNTDGSGTLGERMRVTEKGTVGIGTNRPSKDSRLHLWKSVGANSGVHDLARLELSRDDHGANPSGLAILFKDQDTNNATNEARIKMMTVNDTDYGENHEASSNLLFETTQGGTASDKMIITGRGNIGIGTVNPGYVLDVRGSVRLGNTEANNARIHHGWDSTSVYTGGANTNTINVAYGYNGSYNLHLNYNGYAQGTTQWRNLYVNNGKRGTIAYFYAPNSSLTVNGTQASHTLRVNGTAYVGGYDRVSGSFTVNGDANTYYPCTFWGGGQDQVVEIEIYRSYSATAPSTWNTATHKGGLTFRLSTNFGGWGGSDYDTVIHDFRETYSTIVTRVGHFGNNRGFAIWLRGGGAIYYYNVRGRTSGPAVQLSAYDPGGNNTGVTSQSYSSSNREDTINRYMYMYRPNAIYIYNSAGTEVNRVVGYKQGGHGAN